MEKVQGEQKVGYMGKSYILVLLAGFTLMGSACHAQDMDKKGTSPVVEERINALKVALDQQPELVLDAARVLNATGDLPSTTVKVTNDLQEEIVLDIPESITLEKSGALKSEQFGALQVGTLQAQSAVYDVVHNDYNYGFTPPEIWMTADTDTFSYDALLEREPGMEAFTHADLAIWISTDARPFSMDDYLAAHPNLKTAGREGNHVVGYDIQYNHEKAEAFVQALFTLTYEKVGRSHVFIYGKVTRSEVKNFPNREVMNRFINIFHLIAENIYIHPQG